MNYLILISTIICGSLSFFWFKGIFSEYKYSDLKSGVFSLIISISMLGIIFWLSLLIELPFLNILIVSLLTWLVVYLKWKPKNIIPNLHIDVNWSIMVLFSLVAFIIHHQKWGGWDAWAIWNLHAKFILDSNTWSNMFAPPLEWTHTDYPLLLPAINAMIWTCMEDITPMAPAMTAMLIYVCINTLIYDAVKKQPFVATLVLLSMLLGYDYTNIAASEYADSFVALALLITIILLYEKPRQYILLSGVFCGLALSLKNEGMVFFTIILTYQIFIERLNIKLILTFLLGSLPFLFIVLCFKYFWAPANDIVAGQSISTIEYILSPMRYFHIIRFALETLFTKYYMLLLVIILSCRFRKSFVKEIWILNVIILSYLAIYLVTPKDLIWHMSTSMKRLFHHVYPSYLFLILMSTSLVNWNLSLESLSKRFNKFKFVSNVK